MKASLIVAVLLIGAAPMYAQGQQPDPAKLKADAQKVVSIISGDKAKMQTYCQMSDIAGDMDEAEKENDRKES